MVPRPLTSLSWFSSCCSCTALPFGLTELGCCAPAGAASATTKTSARAPASTRKCATNFVIPSLLLSNTFESAARSLAPRRGAIRSRCSRGRRFANPRRRSRSRAAAQSGRDVLVVGGLPTPGAGAVAAPRHPLLVDLGDDVAVAGQERLGRAHLGAQRQLAFGQAVGAVFLVLFLAAV